MYLYTRIFGEHAGELQRRHAQCDGRAWRDAVKVKSQKRLSFIVLSSYFMFLSCSLIFLPFQSFVLFISFIPKNQMSEKCGRFPIKLLIKRY